MFYAAEALLDSEGLSCSTHAEVISAIGRLFAKTGKAPAEFHRMLIKAQDLRVSGDYDQMETVTPGQAHEQIAGAARFLKWTGEYLS